MSASLKRISSSLGWGACLPPGAEMLTPEVVFDIAKKVVAEGGRAVVAVPYLADLKGMEVEENIEVTYHLQYMSRIYQDIHTIISNTTISACFSLHLPPLFPTNRKSAGGRMLDTAIISSTDHRCKSSHSRSNNCVANSRGTW